MAHGIAAFCWGGRDHKDLAEWSISVADFPTANRRCSTPTLCPPRASSSRAPGIQSSSPSG
eukprot:3425522-Pyramimonas_sp.AAC.1